MTSLTGILSHYVELARREAKNVELDHARYSLSYVWQNHACGANKGNRQQTLSFQILRFRRASGVRLLFATEKLCDF